MKLKKGDHVVLREEVLVCISTGRASDVAPTIATLSIVFKERTMGVVSFANLSYVSVRIGDYVLQVKKELVERFAPEYPEA